MHRVLVSASALLLTLPGCTLEPDQLLPPRPPGHPFAYVGQGLAGRDDIFLLSADARSDVNLTNLTSYDSWPSWSPDGTTLAFESNRDEDVHPTHTEIYALTLASTAVQRLTDDTAFTSTQPAWSPLGDRIAFVSDRDSAKFDIYLMNVDGTNVTRLTTDITNEVQPAWSPDGAKIAFATDRDGTNGEIYVMDSTGANPVNLTNHTANDLAPVWSPDGTKIAFMSNREPEGLFAIWIMKANGDSAVKVSPIDPECELPSWTPDGLRLAFDCDSDVWVANADGTGLTRITRTTFQQRREIMPRWKPGP